MYLRFAVDHAFALKTFPNMATFLGQPIHPICLLVIYFYGGILREECFRYIWHTSTVRLRIPEEINAMSPVISM
jgi:hypothetical protein